MNSLKLLFTFSLLFCLFQIQSQTTEVTITKGTSFKSEGNSSSKTISRLSPNDKVIFLNDCNVYYCKVELNGKIGWVKKQLIEKIPSAEDFPQKEEKDAGNLKQSDNNEDTIQSSSENGEEIGNTKFSNSSSGFPYGIIFIGSLLILGLSYLSYNLFLKNKNSKRINNELNLKYQGIIDVDEEVNNKKNEVSELEKQRNELRSKYHSAKEVYEKLMHENNLLKDDLGIAEFGIYEPQFDYETSAIFKLKIKEIRDKQKKMITNKEAFLGGEGWTVNGSASKGRVMVNKQKKLMLRAFNGECDNFINGVKWNNETRMEERILKSVETINKMGESQGIEISSDYSSLKLLELRLTHEYEIKKYEEKEIQREIREKIRDEEKARKEYEKAQRDAKKEEKLLHDAMEKAKAQLAKASAEEKAIYESKLVELEGKLKIAEENNQRAISMAQQTKAGHVYVISNIGSFGENIFKIGMTRRLEPMDRVTELGDASVPFRFDVHAMIYSENAPDLENQLHKEFDKYRLNHINRRREYFNVSLEEIEKVVKENYGEIEFIIEPEAKEYRESVVIREKSLSIKKSVKKVNKELFPDDLF
ncbi:MAG: DUF4041 domain-containing protein [Saprospiraceae bacterium]